MAGASGPVHVQGREKLGKRKCMSLLLLKEIIIIFLFVVTAAGVVPCGILKKRPRTSSIVQFIFYFWSFEISRNILRNQKTSV